MNALRNAAPRAPAVHSIALCLATLFALAGCGGGYGSSSYGGSSGGSMGGYSAPSITAQPANASATAGQTATFTVMATGVGTLTYQWMKNSVNIAGAMAASYTTPALTSADNNAQFAVKVTDAYGTTTSNHAILTVQ